MELDSEQALWLHKCCMDGNNRLVSRATLSAELQNDRPTVRARLKRKVNEISKVWYLTMSRIGWPKHSCNLKVPCFDNRPEMDWIDEEDR
jgi:hypothetical protein